MGRLTLAVEFFESIQTGLAGWKYPGPLL